MTERASRKPIPRTMRGWKAEVDGIKHVVAAYERLTLDNGLKWVQSMSAYHKERLAVLYANKPKLPVKKRK